MKFIVPDFLTQKQKEKFTGIVENKDGKGIIFAKIYLVDGEQHRLDGPAVEYANGHKYWWYQGQWINVKSQEEFESWLAVAAFE